MQPFLTHLTELGRLAAAEGIEPGRAKRQLLEITRSATSARYAFNAYQEARAAQHQVA